MIRYKNLLKFYVLRHNINSDRIENFNVFNNIRVYEWSVKAIQKYKTDRDRAALRARILSAMREEWGRCEYEIVVSGLFSKEDREEKWDCFGQFEPNIDLFVDYIVFAIEHDERK